MSTPLVSVASLTRVATEYSDVLRALPAFQFNEVAAALALNILSVNGKHVQVNPRRQAGLLKPYVAGLDPATNKEVAKFFESVLEPKLVYGAADDNITNYREKKVISNKGEKVNLKEKNHPLEFFIIKSMIESFNEDVIFQMFFGERAEDGTTAATAFNGFYTIYDMLVTAGEISEAKGNLHTTGAFVAPASGTDTAAYDKLVAFVKAGHPLLRRGEVNLMASSDLIMKARDAFRNKTKNYEYSTTEQMIERLRDDAQAPSLKLITHEALGVGDKLTLLKPGLLDFGMGDQSDKDYVQVRAPYTDPNMVQFWMEAAFDTRVNDVHAKVFLTNEQTSTAVDLAGDYKPEVVPPVGG